jgi:cardiolipin synthase
MSPARTSPGARRRLAEQPDLLQEVERVLGPRGVETRSRRLVRALVWRWVRTLRKLRPLGGASTGNRIEAFTDGDAVFEAMWAAIDGARRRVVVETYRLGDDRVGRRTLEVLTRAAQRGVEVLVVADAFGSSLDEGRVEELEQAGGRLVEFNPLLQLRSKYARSTRDHRKLLVVDGETAFCGGLNLAEEYAGPEHGTGLFRDALLRLEGPCAVDLERLVLETLGDCTGDAPALSPVAEPDPDGQLVQVLESNRRRKRRAIQRSIRVTVGRAARRVLVTSPYFVPPRSLIRALSKAAARGVEVCVLTAGRSDVPIVRLASQHLYGRLLRAGVRVFEMRERTLHAKTIAIDGVYVSVGSFNLDAWSYRRNLEVNVSALDPELAAELERQFTADLDISEEVTLQGWRQRSIPERAVHWLTYQLLRI